MAIAKTERRMEWLKIESGERNGIDDYIERKRESEIEEKMVMIGGWYYYLDAGEDDISLCRTKSSVKNRSLTETIRPEECAISDDDLEMAVKYWTCGFHEPGIYRISPHIERKLRILFE